MSMKLTDLMKLRGKQIAGRMGGATPDRFGKGAAEVLDKREQRRRDHEAGLVPFAVKLHGDLVKQLHALAQERQVSLNDLTADLLNAGMGSAAAPARTAEAAPAKPAEKPAAKPPAKPAPKVEAKAEPKATPASPKPATKKAAETSAKTAKSTQKTAKKAEPPKPAAKQPTAKKAATKKK